MKKLSLIAGLICSLSIPSQSQESQAKAIAPPSSSLDYQFRQIKNELYNLGLSSYVYKNYKDIQGSPYLNPELKDGKIITVEGKILVGKLRFNIFTDEIEFEYKNNLLSIAKPDNFKEFYIDQEKLAYVAYLEGKKPKKSFMLIQEEGQYTLMVKKIVEYFGQEKRQPYSVPKPDRFEAKNDILYINSKNQPAHKVTSLKKLLKTFPELNYVIRGYPEKRIDFDNLDDVKKLVAYINDQLIDK